MSTDNGQLKLSSEAREAIRHYLINIFTVPGIFLVVVSFLLGYFIRDVAVSKAELQATQKAEASLREIYSRSMSSLEEILIKKSSLDTLLEENKKTVRSIKEQHENLLEKIKLNKRNLEIIPSIGESGKLVQEISSKLKNDPHFVRTTTDEIAKGEIAHFEHHTPWIRTLGRHGSTYIKVRKGDVVEVSVHGSAEDSEFYYKIIETTDKAQGMFETDQVHMNKGSRWGLFYTEGLFLASSGGTLEFQTEFNKGDISGQVKVYGLTIIAKVIAHRPDLINN